jgi:hypothetical protein
VPILVEIADYRFAQESDWYRRVAAEIMTEFRKYARAPRLGRLPEDHISLRLDFLLPLGRRARKPLIVMIDDIGCIPRGIADRFLGVVRSVSTSPSTDDTRITFVLAGTVDPNELVSQDNPNSPLNTTYPLYTQPFSREEFCQLAANIAHCGPDVSEAALERMYYHTGGHVNLSQKICAEVAGLRSAAVDVNEVDGVVDRFTRSGDENLLHVCKAMRQDTAVAELVSALLRGERLRFDRTDQVVSRAALSGVVGEQGGLCIISSGIYRALLSARLDELRRAPPDADQTGVTGAQDVVVPGADRDRAGGMAATETTMARVSNGVCGRHKRKRRRSDPRDCRLTEKQVQAFHLYSEHKGNCARVARALGLHYSTVRQHINAALRKLGQKASDFRTPPHQNLPHDRRGQVSLPGECDEGRDDS